MKKILGILAVLLLSVAAFGQTTYGVVATGGSVTGGIAGKVKLSGSSTVGVVLVNNTLPFETEGGTVTFQTGAITTGKIQVGGTFLPGGFITVVTDNEGALFSGTFDAGLTWTPSFNANGTHFYVLSGNATDALGNTAQVLLTTTTDTSVTCFFSGSETISSLRLGITIH